MRLIGRPFSDPDLQQDLKEFPFSVTEGPDGFPLIHGHYNGETKSVTPIQVMGMVFSDMKKKAEKNLKAAVVDCCIGIPVYFTDLQRRAVMDAAAIAGLNPLRLLHETTATALAYGLYKTDLCENKQLNVAFVDIGQFSMQVCIAGFKKGEMKILAHFFDRSLGGGDFDELLFDYFAGQFKADYKIDAFHNDFACIMLRAACEKLKEVLRSNPEAPLYVECFIDKKYVRGFMKRDKFEQISTRILERMKKPLEKALLEAKLTFNDIYAVESVGSCSWVIEILTKLFGKEPRRTMNASECVSRGCALECAILSPNYKVREFQVQDNIPFAIALQWKDFTQISLYGKKNYLERCIVFARGNPIPCVKSMTFYRSGTFSLDVKYVNAGELQAPPKISTYTIGPFQSANGEPCKVEVEVGLNLHGCVSVNSAQFLGEGDIAIPIPVSKVEPSKETTKMGMEKGLEVYECLTLPKT
ncbi:hypothetical protein L6452_23564 [Arctium lappa]|uniref:Uncharacterized protein n=1 Tax=Arctium lappa TaxID=4217 RepID=A0ACB9B1T3_ARCLA|nr:hypothetical protein L6452_23564 [Arctium lappa]